MSINSIDQYFLKAWNEYPYNMEIVLENLNYISSYADEHAGVAYLLGLIQYREFGNLRKAEEYFQMAISLDACNPDVFIAYADLLIELDELGNADKLLDYAQSLSDTNKVYLLHRKSLIWEKSGELKMCKRIIKEAQLKSVLPWEIEFLKREMNRIKDKQALLKPKKKKKGNKKSKLRARKKADNKKKKIT